MIGEPQAIEAEIEPSQLAVVMQPDGHAPAAPGRKHDVRWSADKTQLAALVDAVPAMIWTADLDGRRDYFNRAWLEFTGRPLSDELGHGWLAGVHPDDRELTVAEYRQAAENHSSTEFEYRLRCHNGQYRWVLATSVRRVASDGRSQGTLGTCVDITEHRQAQCELEQLLAASDQAHANLAEQTRQLHHLADTDSLTGLLNRRSFREQFEREWFRSLRYQRPLGCIMLDIDFFKRVNDMHGHAAGDAALRKISELLLRQCRPSDVICRYGGEEFCIMVPEAAEAGAVSLAERIRMALAETPIQLGSQVLRVTASFGVADCAGELNNVDELIERADQALHIAKHSGRDRVVSFASEESLAEWASQHHGTRLLAGATARDLLTPTPCIGVDATIAEAVDTLLAHGIGSAPVVDAQGKLAGFVSERDLMMLHVSREAWSAPVRNVMKFNVVCYEEGTPGHQVFQFLCRALIHRVVIAEGGRPLGVIRPASLLAFFRDRVGSAECQVAGSATRCGPGAMAR